MRGIETLPLTLIAVSILILIVASVAFTQINFFLNFNEKREFKEGLASMVQEIKLLKSAGNSGSFSSKSIKIPSGYSITLGIDDDVIVGSMTDETYNVTLSQLPVDITAFSSGGVVVRNGTAPLGGGSDYRLLFYYGSLPDNQFREYMLTFE